MNFSKYISIYFFLLVACFSHAQKYGGGDGTGYSTETISSVSLPVELIDFTATIKGEAIQLSWQTATERHNEGFEIQKSKDGANWEKIGFVQGQGTSFTMTNYKYDDQHPFNGENYYRLKQLDFDGVFTYSAVVVIKKNMPLTLKLYPNPTPDKVYLEGDLEDCSISLFHADGRLLRTLTNVNTPMFDLNDLGTGIYFIQVFNKKSGQLKTHHILKN